MAPNVIKFKFLMAFLMIQNIESAWLDRRAEGWAWYEDKNEEIPMEPEKQEEIQIQPEAKLAEVKLTLERKLAQAILEPTIENVHSYQVEQLKWLKQSEKFADVWSYIVLNHPELNPTNEHPASQYGLKVKKEIEKQKNEQIIMDAAKEYGLFFFYEGASKASQAFVSVVKLFEKKYNLTTCAITVDKVTLKDFPNSIENLGITERIGVSVVPALYFVNPVNQTFIPISFGMQTLDQIEKNVITQFTGVQE